MNGKKKIVNNKKDTNSQIIKKKKKIKDKKEYGLAIGGGASFEEIKIIKELLKEEIKNAKIYKEMTVPPVFGVHLGPKSILVSVVDYEN